MGRIFGLDQQTLISVGIQLFNACLLAVALTYILYKPVRKFLQKRADGIQARIMSAEEDMAKADEWKALYEQKTEDIEREREGILEEARKFATEKTQRALDEAAREAAAMKARAEAEIRAERMRAREDMKRNIIEIAALMADKFVKSAIDEEQREKLFNEALYELEAQPWQD
jgi:F-type H+-transporting ATPase subunit b